MIRLRIVHVSILLVSPKVEVEVVLLALGPKAH